MLEFMTALAREAGQLVVEARRQGSDTVTDFKAGHEMVTEADLRADELISRRIREAFPEHRILAEESAPDTAGLSRISGPLWIIDPIDGTVNYAHGHHQVGISIAYAEDGELRSAVVFNPFLDELFCASRGQGATLNGSPIHVAGKTELRRTLVATGFPYVKENMDLLIRRLDHVLRECADLRRIGSAALDICWVAAGRLDAYYENLSVWDFAAAQLIAIEAGARYGHFQPVPPGISPVFHDQNILVANPALYPQMEALLQAADAAEA